MSTKVYTAYKLKSSKDLWPWVRDTRVRGELEVQKALREFYRTMSEAVVADSDEYKERAARGETDGYIRLDLSNKAIRSGYQKQLGDAHRSPFNFDVSVVIREHRKGLYIIPYCDMMMRHTLDFLSEDKRLVDFAYWNNTDQPEHITDAAWKRRGKVWDALDANNGWGNYLAIEVMSWNKFYQIDPLFEMLGELRATEKAAKADG